MNEQDEFVEQISSHPSCSHGSELEHGWSTMNSSAHVRGVSSQMGAKATSPVADDTLRTMHAVTRGQKITECDGIAATIPVAVRASGDK